MKKSKKQPTMQFLLQDERGMSIFEEFNAAKKRFEDLRIQNSIVVFGSARIKADDEKQNCRYYYDQARKLSNRLAAWSKETFKDSPPEDKYYIVTGGGMGIMEAANRGAAEAGEPTVGLNILLPYEQIANEYIPKELIIPFHYFFIRKFFFVYYAKAFIIFPGGFGTFDELFEIITLAQTQKMQETIPFVIFGKNFFEKVLNVDMLLEHGLISESDKKLYIITDDIEEAYTHITSNILKDSELTE
ncbi:MAG: TIGR00730 family Rossman fold protein [Oscillospiraceae bacterium]|nr:TIGR00730 family Rossman fold protein [Oscillospiraceae bacterium]